MDFALRTDHTSDQFHCIVLTNRRSGLGYRLEEWSFTVIFISRVWLGQPSKRALDFRSSGRFESGCKRHTGHCFTSLSLSARFRHLEWAHGGISQSGTDPEHASFLPSC